MSLLALDARWKRFNDESRACPCCGRQFSGIFDLGFGAPKGWEHGDLPEGEEVLQAGDDFLTADLCKMGEARLVRALVPLPLRGSDEVFHFGAWASLAPEKARAYVAASEQNDPSLFEGGFAWLANDLPGFESDDPIACNLWPDPDPRMRPHLKAQSGPLKAAQDNGISFDELLDIYAASGEDIRPHLIA